MDVINHIIDQLKNSISKGMKITLLAAILAASTSQAARAEPITIIGLGWLGAKIVTWWAGKAVIAGKAATIVKAATVPTLKGGLTGGANGALTGQAVSKLVNAGAAQSRQIIKSQAMRGAATGALQNGTRAAVQTYKQLN